MSLRFLQLHLGSWQGWFRAYDPNGQLLGQKASEITFRELGPQTYEQVNRFGSQSQRWVYASLAAGLRFFPDGSFSNGQIQLAPFAGFAVEQGFLWQNRKARLVQQWDPQGDVTHFTTILETRHPEPTADAPDTAHASTAPELLPWDGAGLEGTWTGTAITYGADRYHPESGSLTLPDLPAWWHEQTPQARIQFFPGQMVAIYPAPLPIPTRTRDRHFVLHLGWLADPDHYLHLSRTYNRQGTWDWVSSACLTRSP